MNSLIKIAFGGGCHWCTEAVFQSLIGVIKVEQGFIASTNENSSFSEAVIIHFDDTKIELKTLIKIHLQTHKSTSEHSMRKKYRSAVYVFSEDQKKEVTQIITKLQNDFNNQIITKVLEYCNFKPSENQFKNYFYNNPEKPFCKTYIDPKLKLLERQFSNHLALEKIKILTI
ncbi:peptide-methionine (S)-S-oxide reductase [Lutibacter sp. Hel_I_33_5]|uniref:peptide-methionine (S)-S-oxide reductase n=1 Tax=Lutibacter sp. Hel_I_33_5 TaxID=1566289 RepID=UPI0011AA5623|nr:peptide-methionine (S)-S-oxide reductase [Lutibacter sp. Hel_I_33_5]TVZ56004.1 peptide-methionine (S)-S-oxide reductase [Lutibacter sp. Hel_I_33_5]